MLELVFTWTFFKDTRFLGGMQKISRETIWLPLMKSLKQKHWNPQLLLRQVRELKMNINTECGKHGQSRVSGALVLSCWPFSLDHNLLLELLCAMLMLFWGEKHVNLHFFKNCREDLYWTEGVLPLWGILSRWRTLYTVWEEVSPHVWASSWLLGISGGDLCQSKAWPTRMMLLLHWAVLYGCVSNALALIIV